MTWPAKCADSINRQPISIRYSELYISIFDVATYEYKRIPEGPVITRCMYWCKVSSFQFTGFPWKYQHKVQRTHHRPQAVCVNEEAKGTVVNGRQFEFEMFLLVCHCNLSEMPGTDGLQSNGLQIPWLENRRVGFASSILFYLLSERGGIIRVRT